jgi:hypothetical protein
VPKKVFERNEQELEQMRREEELEQREEELG